MNYLEGLATLYVCTNFVYIIFAVYRDVVQMQNANRYLDIKYENQILDRQFEELREKVEHWKTSYEKCSKELERYKP